VTTIFDQPVQPVDFDSGHGSALPVEVLAYSGLVERVGTSEIVRAQRPSFELMILVRSGTGFHTVDFHRHALYAGRVLFVRPGQVQQWHVNNTLDAAIVLAAPTVATAASWLPCDAAYADLSESSMRTAVDLVAAIEREQQRFSADEHSIRLLTSLFAALVALFQRASNEPRRGSLPAAYRAFRAALEDDLTRSRNVRDYVTALGYSERTVSRACQLVTGLTAKALLDARLMLEAKRLLAHSDRTVASISSRLGFSEPTNFTKFFDRVVGTSPVTFRRELRDAGYRSDSGR
jgi:AraC-like DNA-binding protein